jgi:hypothetical protein
MKIAIYKPFKKLFFVDDKEDNAAWSYEIVNMSQILRDHGHEVHIISDNDLDLRKDGQYPGIINHFPVQSDEKFDRILIWCGSFQLDTFGDEIITMLRKMTERLDFMLTDAKLTPTDPQKLAFFDNIYLQGTKALYTDNDVCGGLSELLLYKFEYPRTLDEAITSKDIEFYFGGTERDRLDDFIEYVWRPGHLITTKTKFFGLENRTPRDEFKKTLDKAKYSVVITDIQNNINHFISPRPYECYIHDIVAFFDYKYDPDEYYCKKDDYRRVHNYKEMRIKMNELNAHPELYRNILALQRDSIKENFVNGEYIYGIIK